MKQTKIFIAMTALVLAGCYSTTGVRRPDPNNPQKTIPVVEVRDNGDSPEKVDSKGRFLGKAAAAQNATDRTLNPAERTVNAAIAAGADLRGLARVFHEGAVNSAADPATGAPAFTEVQKKLLGAGFIFEGGKLYAPKNLDPARQTPINEEEAILIYKYKDASDYGPAKPLIDSIKAKY